MQNGYKKRLCKVIKRLTLGFTSSKRLPKVNLYKTRVYKTKLDKTKLDKILILNNSL